MTPVFPETIAREILARALKEDLGAEGDITTRAIASSGSRAEAALNTRETITVAGLPLASLTFDLLAPGKVVVSSLVQEGSQVPAGTCLARIEGDAGTILSGERVLLNVLARLCGIATLTAQATAEISGTGCRVADTRKTTPGLRALEKYAVAVGGGENHRFGLNCMVLVKDNHKALAGGLPRALDLLWTAGHRPADVEVEVETLDELDQVLSAGVGWVLLDNMSLALVQEAVRRTAGRACLEVSGGMRPGRLRPFAEAGVQRISLGCLTHGARSADLGLDFFSKSS